MKKFLAVLLLLCVALSLAACNKDQTPDGMKDAAIENADYHLYVPEVWITTNTMGLSGAHAGAADKDFSPNVIVTVYYPDTVIDLPTYFTTVAKPQLDSVLEGLSMVEEGKAATLGGKVKVPTLDDAVEYDIPEGTQSGETFRIRGKGIKTSRGVGNLYLHVIVEVPKLSREQKKQLEKVYDDVGLKQQEQMKKYADNMSSLYGVNVEK